MRLVGEHGDPGAAQALVPEHPADAGEVLGVALEDRQLDAVVARPLQLGEQGEVLVGDVGGPEQEVEAEQHGGLTRTSG